MIKVKRRKRKKLVHNVRDKLETLKTKESKMAREVLRKYRKELMDKDSTFEEMIEDYKVFIKSFDKDVVFKAVYIKKVLKDVRLVDIDELIQEREVNKTNGKK